MRNLNFGFITIEGNRSIEDAIAKLNDIKIGPASLKASRARYSAPRTFAASKLRVTTSNSKKVYRDSKRDHRSFSDVVASKGLRVVSHEVSQTKGVTEKGESGSIPSVVAATDPIETTLALKPAIWKSRACLVRVINIASIRNTYDILMDHGFQVDFAAPCGDNNVIMAFESIDTLNNFLLDEWKALNHVIASVDSIRSDYAPTECLVYIDLMGIPPVFICEDVVRDLASRYGKVVAIDSELARPDRLDVVSCLVSVPVGTEAKNMKITVGSKEFTIFSAIRQGVGCDHCNGQDIDDSDEEGIDSECPRESASVDGEDSDDHIVRPREGVSGMGAVIGLENNNSARGEAENNLSTEPSTKSASLNSGSMNNLIIQEEVEEQGESDVMLTFKVGKTLGLFNEQDAREVMGLLGGKR